MRGPAMLRLQFLVVVLFGIHLAPSYAHPDAYRDTDLYRDVDLYSPAFKETLHVPKKLAVPRTPTARLPWIDSQIRDDVEALSDTVSKEFASRIKEICDIEITIDQVELIVSEILNPSETPTYLDMLPEACSMKITATVPYLLDDPYHRILAGFQNHKGNDAYLEAVMSNHKERLFHLSRVEGLNYDRPNRDGITALLAACRFGNRYEVKRILRTKNKLTYGRRDPHGRTALHLYAQYGDSGRHFQRLMEQYQWDVNDQDIHGNTVLHLAYSNVLYGEHQSVTTMDENSSTTESQTSNPADSILEYLLKKVPHLDENIRNGDGDTVLHMACRELEFGLVNILLPRETIDITIHDSQGLTALDIILESGKMATSWDDISRFAKCLAAFIVKGAYENATERFGSDANTVLHLMCLTESNAALSMLMKSPPVEQTNLTNKFGLTPFEIAFKKDGNKIGPMTSAFIENGRADVVAQLDRGDTILHIACRDRDLGTVKLLMDYPLAQVNHKNHLNQTPLHILYQSQFAMVTGPLTPEQLEVDHTERPTMPKTEAFIMEVLLSNPNTDPNIRNFEGDALIHTACRKNDYATVSMLLKHKRTIVNLMGRNDQTPIQIAFDLEHLSKLGKDCWKCEGDSACPKRSVLCLLLRNPEVNPVVKSEGSTLLHLACDVSNVAAIRLLLNNKNTVVDAEDSGFRTPLKLAYLRDNHKNRRNRFGIGAITKMLLESSRISPNEPMNDNGDTLLHLACRDGDLEAVQFLLKLQKIDVNSRNKQGRTPLKVAYDYDQRSAEDLRETTPYIGALTKAILGGPHPDCNVPLDGDYNTILHILTESYYSCNQRQQASLRSLIKRILSEQLADPNVENRHGLRSLWIIYRNEKLSFTKKPSTTLLPLFLESKDIDPNIPLGENHGGSLLHVACFESNQPAVATLLNHPNIDIMVQDSNGFIPFEIAWDVDMEKGNANGPNQSSKAILKMIFDVGKQRLNEAGTAFLLQIMEKGIQKKSRK